MSLELIIGPPSSGRTGEVLGRVAAASSRSPLVVVPNRDDADRVETEIAGRGAGLGITVVTFGGLEAEIARRTAGPVRRAAGAVERRQLLRAAIRSARLGPLRASAERPGFLAEVGRLISELSAAGSGARELAARGPESDQPGLISDLGRIVAAYEGALKAAELGGERDRGRAALAGLRAGSGGWGARPIALLGFDDLDPLQIDLISELGRMGEVIVSVTYEDRMAANARSRLTASLLERGATVAAELTADPANTSSAALHHLERSFCEPAAPAPVDEGVGFLLASGRRGAVEQVGADVARLLAAGEDPGEIAIVCRNPARDAELWESVLERFGIGAAIDAAVSLESTATGRGLCALARCALEGEVADLLGFLRAPRVASRAAVDRLERRVRRDGLDSALLAETEHWQGRELFELADLRRALEDDDAVAALGSLARSARRLAERPHLRTAPTVGRRLSLELRAGEAAATALAELAELAAAATGDRPARELMADALAELEATELRLHDGSSETLVRVTDPYRIRARRVRSLYVCDLEEGEFPRASAPDTLLSDASRTLLGLPPRAERLDEERFLFWNCLSRASERVRLCWRVADDEGVATLRSPFADEVLGLLAGGEELLEQAERRELAAVTFEPAVAPGADERARSLAARNLECGSDPAIADRLTGAREARERDVKHDVAPSPALDELAERRLFGASTLEDYATCSFRWFIGHELRPRDLEPDPEPLVQGSLVHAVLERLYREPPAGARPTAANIDAWLARASDLLAELAGGLGLGGDDSRGRISRARAGALVANQLVAEAASEGGLVPDPDLIEAAFGEGPDDARGPLELDGLSLHGKIDRVDVAPGGAGLVRDYKTGARVAGRAAIAEDGKLQLQLYSLALERLWGRHPLGGLYEPLGATSDRRARGIVASAADAPEVEGMPLVSTDVMPESELRELLGEAAGEASGIAAAMRAGVVRPEPRHDECPRFCDYAPICRRQRARLPEALEDEDPDEPRQARAF